MVRLEDQMLAYIDGIETHRFQIPVNRVFSSNGEFPRIGHRPSHPTIKGPLHGDIVEFRIVKGKAEFLSRFPRATAPYTAEIDVTQLIFRPNGSTREYRLGATLLGTCDKD